MKNLFLQTNDESKCCGCTGCVQICPTQCLQIEQNSEGFEYPIISDASKCINCGLCRNVCPMESNTFSNSCKRFVGAINKDEKILMRSSSGGVFAQLAINVLAEGGIVYGVSMKDDFNVLYTDIEKMEQLTQLLGSKYVQATSIGVFENIKKHLNLKPKVFVCGTPCFIAGLKKFLNKEYENLWTADLICHGVPSQKIFKKYIHWLEKKNRCAVTNFEFRNKQIYGWGITASYKAKGRLISELTVSSPYVWGYLKNYLHRPSCYSCPYATTNRAGDITIGDFWDMDKADCKLNGQNGVSLVKINNDIGAFMFDTIKNQFIHQEMDYQKCIPTNGALYESSHKPKNRDLIYANIDNMPFDMLAKKYFEMPNQIVVKIKKILPVFLKEGIKRVYRSIRQ